MLQPEWYTNTCLRDQHQILRTQSFNSLHITRFVASTTSKTGQAKPVSAQGFQHPELFVFSMMHSGMYVGVGGRGFSAIKG
jgi:hypothetical protein